MLEYIMIFAIFAASQLLCGQATPEAGKPRYPGPVPGGYLLPNGWTADEGPFGEFAGMQGDLKHNPIFRVNAITHRRQPIFQILQMPWENDWLNGPATEAACRRALGLAGIQVSGVRATEGGCCGWSVVAAIKKRAGEGRNAIAALLSLPVVKQVIVTDDDINIDDPNEVEWAVTFRCQADKDIVILSGMKGKHVDPSVRPVSPQAPAQPVAPALAWAWPAWPA